MESLRFAFYSYTVEKILILLKIFIFIFYKKFSSSCSKVSGQSFVLECSFKKTQDNLCQVYNVYRFSICWVFKLHHNEYSKNYLKIPVSALVSN